MQDMPHFARSEMNGIEANGYNTSSPGESMNNLLKQGLSSAMTLRESREHFDHVLDSHEQNGFRSILPGICPWNSTV